MKRRLLDAAGLLVAGALAWWAWTRADPQAVAATFRGGDPGWLLLALATLLIGHSTRIFRWSALCASAGASRREAAIAAPVGLLAVTLLPFRLGEGVRLALQRRLDEGSRVTGLVGLTLVERAGDLLGILLLVAVGAGAAGSWWPAMGLAGGLAAGAGVVHASARLAAWQAPARLRPITALVARLAGLLLVQRPAALAQVAVSSVLAWAGDAVAVFLLARAFGAGIEAGLAAAAAGWVALGVALPTAPAGLGTHQAVMAWALGGVVTHEQAIAVSIGMLALIVVVQALLSAVALGALAVRAALRPQGRSAERIRRAAPPRPSR